MMIPLSELVDKYNVRPRGIIHVGAHEGEELASYLEYKVPNVVWIEANPEIWQKLIERLRPYPHHRAFQFAAYDHDGDQVDLHVMTNTMSSSIFSPKKHLDFYPSVTVTKDIRVSTRTLDSLFFEEDLVAEDFDFLNMDVQGAELLVLRGARNTLGGINYIYTEVNDDYLFDGCCLTPELDQFLAAEGFFRIATRMTEDKWGDAFYVRR